MRRQLGIRMPVSCYRLVGHFKIKWCDAATKDATSTHMAVEDPPSELTPSDAEAHVNDSTSVSASASDRLSVSTLPRLRGLLT